MLWLLILLPFAGSLAAAFLPSRGRNAAGLLAGGVTLACAVILVILYTTAIEATPLRTVRPWLDSLDLNLIFRLDGVAWLFAFMVAAIGFLVVLYARYYMSTSDPVPRFFSFLLGFMGSMMALVLSGNLIQIAFFWELTSLFSFLLIGYWHHNESARSGARMALLITATGGLSLLVGLLLIGRIAGSYDLDVVLASGDLIKASPLYLPALGLILVGAFTKSAQFPFHFWLPHAMAAPTPVSAYLHSATMVKAGIFVMIRFWPVLAGTDSWHLIVSTAGLATLVVGAWAAMFQQDLKGLLAYSTISHLGIITLLLGIGSPLGLVAAIFHTINHATFKASLFMAAGIIDHEAGTRDLRRLGGLFRAMPHTATLAMVAAAAMAGVPLLNGFLSKEMFLAETIEGVSGSSLDTMLPMLATIGLTFSVVYSVRFIHQTFFGPLSPDLPKQPHEAPFWMRVPIGVLVITCITIGVFPALTVGTVLAAASRSVLGPDLPYYSLAIWHGLTTPLLLSVVALVGGVIVYAVVRNGLNQAAGVPMMSRWRGKRTFELTLAAIIRASRALLRRIGSNRLQPQLRLMVLIAMIAALLPFLRHGYTAGFLSGTLIDPGFGVLWLVGGACAIGAAWQAKYRRVAALILIAGAGLVSCVSFVWLSAPDLALTQLLVETVTTVLLLLSLRWLPERKPEMQKRNSSSWSVWRRRGTDLLLAIVAGMGIALLSYAIMTQRMPDSVSRYFVENAYSQGGGRNVVNVTLVDFRAFDTLGEITVLAIVALTIFSLLRRFRPASESVRAPKQQRVQAAFDSKHEQRSIGDTLSESLLVPQLIMEWLFPIILVFAAYLLLRGHDLPGGGFAAGVTVSIALILQYLAAGTRSVEARVNVRPLRWIGIGLLVAVGTGVGAMSLGYPFLTSAFRYADLPIIGEVPMASALIFDLGVFMVVIGTTVLMLIALAHQSIRAPQGLEERAARRAIEAEDG